MLKHSVPDYSKILGKYTSPIHRLANSTLNEISSEFAPNFKEFIRYLKKEPVTKICCDIKAMRAISIFGEYTNRDKKIEAEIRGQLEKINLDKKIGQLASYMPLGFSTAEIEFGIKDHKVVLKGLDVLEQQRTKFRGRDGVITEVVYSDITQKYIPYWKCIHIVNGYITDFDEAFGVPEIFAALPYIKAKMSFLSSMVTNGQNLAAGKLIVKTSTDMPVKLYDSDGKYLNKTLPLSVDVKNKVENLNNSGFIVTDKNVDFMPIVIPDGSNFYLPALRQMDKEIMRAFHIPELVFTEGTTALTKTATLAGAHLGLMDANIRAGIHQMRQEMINKVIKPIIFFNYGPSPNDYYGSFEEIDTLDESNRQTLLTNIFQGITYNVLSTDEFAVQNKIRELLHLPMLSELEKEKIQAEAIEKKMVENQAQLRMQEQSMEAQQALAQEGKGAEVENQAPTHTDPALSAPSSAASKKAQRNIQGR
jgi:hypothetical protein